jgi:outer membrane murein-binding lipoprotein Lpp
MKIAAASVLVSLMLAGCSPESTNEPVGPTPNELAAQERATALAEHFPAVDPTDPAALVAEVRANFEDRKFVEVSASPGLGDTATPSRVRVTPRGVHTWSGLGNPQTQSITLADGRVWLSGPRSFWKAAGMKPPAAETAAEKWVRVEAAASDLNTRGKVLESVYEAFEVEWGEGLGTVELLWFEGKPAVKVETGKGSLVAAGSPLLPVRSTFDDGGVEVESRFTYTGLSQVQAPPRAGVSLDTIVFR